MNDLLHLFFTLYAFLQHSILVAISSSGIFFFQLKKVTSEGFSWKNVFSFNTYIHVLLVLYNSIQALRGAFGAVFSFDAKYDMISINFSTFLYYLKDGFLLIILAFHILQLSKYLYAENESFQKSSMIVFAICFIFFFLVSVVTSIIKILTVNIVINNRGASYLEYHQGTLIFELFVVVSLLALLGGFLFISITAIKRGETSLKFIISFIFFLETFVLFIVHRICYILMLGESNNRLLYEFVSLFNRLNGVVLTFGILLFYFNNNGLGDQGQVEVEETEKLTQE